MTTHPDMPHHTATQGGEAARMRAAIAGAVAAGPQFLGGTIDADRMAHLMIDAARPWAGHHGAQSGAASDAATAALRHALAELMACGSGYLAGRCDSACVARTMTYMVGEFPPQ